MIDAKRVHELLAASLWTDPQMKALNEDHDEILKRSTAVTGVDGFGLAFNPENLEAVRTEVATMLRALDSAFMESGGGGMSFLQMPFDRSGEHWGEHRHANELLCLGLGLGLCEYLLPRDQWAALPGGVPYVVVKDSLLGAK